MLETLTPEQEKLMDEVAEEWIQRAIGSSGFTVHEKDITKSIEWLWSLSDLPKPNVIIASDPHEAQMIANFVINNAEKKVGDKVGDKVREKVREKVGDKVWVKVGDKVREKVRDKVWDKVGDKVREKVGYNVWEKVGKKLRVKFNKTKKLTHIETESVGLCNIGWVSFYDYFCRIGIIDNDEKLIFNKYITFLNCHVWDIIAFKNMAIVILRPKKISTDSNDNLHCLNGPAIEWLSGPGDYFVHGTSMPNWSFDKKWINKDDAAQRILKEKDRNVQQALAEMLELNIFFFAMRPEQLDKNIIKTWRMGTHDLL